LVSATKQEELNNLLRELDGKRRLGPLDPANPPPEGFEIEAAAIWPDSGFGHLASDAVTSAGPARDESTEQRAERLAEEERLKAAEDRRREPFRTWTQEERARYLTARKKAEDLAQSRAEQKIPQSIDISLLGGGWSFLLEFSTVIVILFVLLCLAVLGSITGKDALTVLASIAGYVLGKASSQAQKPEAERQPSPPQPSP
jgi:hypothetical protein